MTVLLELAVTDSRSGLSLADADRIVSAAGESGIGVIRLLDRAGGSDAAGTDAVDPSVVASYLAARHPQLGFLVDATTTHNAPYNLARRVSSLDRATDGRAGLVLRPGEGDEVSDGVTLDSVAFATSDRWAEYAEILTRLWESFPAAALVGDQERAIVVDDSLIRSIDHEGSFYRVAGPLDGPSSVQGRPALVIADPEVVGWTHVATHADAVIVDDHTRADGKLADALAATGRARTDIALLVRVTAAEDYRERLEDRLIDGVVLAPHVQDVDSIVDLVRSVSGHGPGRTLRATLGLRALAEGLV